MLRFALLHGIDHQAARRSRYLKILLYSKNLLKASACPAGRSKVVERYAFSVSIGFVPFPQVYLIVYTVALASTSEYIDILYGSIVHSS